ncbi:hypothetical protein E2C01_053750 [Portunus trituberculatus]|uniref:Uncharacterized protein n=1 Tax=Portunus trituberculatus TaxID=210409 RepID=A0A5B7GL66_PORTR|nr:hypothetical protein [Portunus trituberculatus]
MMRSATDGGDSCYLAASSCDLFSLAILPSPQQQGDTVATNSKERAQLLASLFDGKMKVRDLQQPSAQLFQQWR